MPKDIEDISSKGDNVKYWLAKYPDASEDIDERLPENKVHSLSTSMYSDPDHAHDKVMQRFVSGVLCFVGLTHISWTSKRQGTIEISSYSAELCTG